MPSRQIGMACLSIKHNMEINPNIILEEVEITDAGSNGKAIGKYNNVVVFVPFAAPGDIVDIRIVFRQKNYLEGRIVAVHKFSENRVNSILRTLRHMRRMPLAAPHVQRPAQI